ncbi:FISUMP domain-containing protein [Riemerella anatipestifer]|nr:FISUMP domain-containing protein [Riemerella anatipestifer]
MGILDNGANKLVAKIPYKNGQGSYTAVESQEVTTAIGQDGDTNTVKLTIPQGNFMAKGSLDATIVVGGTDSQYKVRLLQPGEEYTIATIPYTFNGESYQLVLKGIGGILDRCFGKTTLERVGYGANVKEHEFIYLPVQGPDGKIWLNNNLGAEYARVGSQWFNPAYQAGALDPANTTIAVPLYNPTADQIKMDWRAYGSLFQWQRNPDGHELINWTYIFNDITPKYNTTSSSSNSWTNPGHNLFITGSDSNGSWVNSSLYSSGPRNLWQSSGVDKTNPCPSGYHVPTRDEQVALHNAILKYDAGDTSTFSSEMWDEQELRLPASGVRGYSDGSFGSQSSYGFLWSSEQWDYGEFSWNLWFAPYMSGYSSYGIQANGFSVRCIKDN